MYLNEHIPEPETLCDTYENRASAARLARMRVGPHSVREDVKCEINYSMPERDLRRWAYQRYIKDCLRVIASVDDNVGRVLDYLDAEGLTDNTIVVCTSDQGFFLGDHGWYDKRLMYEESLRMPFVIRWPREVRPGSVNDDIVTNVDFAPTFLDAAGVEVPEDMQGSSFRPLLRGHTPDDWQRSMCCRYWMHLAHHYVCAHYGVRTRRHKLIYYYADDCGQPGTPGGGKFSTFPAARGQGENEQPGRQWELFDLEKDPHELNNVYGDPACAGAVRQLSRDLERLQRQVGDEPYEPPP